jgi:non-homologous end joining protein Ku
LARFGQSAIVQPSSKKRRERPAPSKEKVPGSGKGCEYQRGQFVTFTAKELKALDVESSKVIDLEKFVPRGDIDPVYFDSRYYLYPDGPVAIET